MTIFLTGLAVWAVSGLIIAGFLARHGHNFWLLALMGLGFGPLLLLIWGQALHRLPAHVTMVQSKPVAWDAGWIDVLVGLDGSDESVESASQVLSTLGPAVGRVRLTSVLDHQIATAPDAFTLDDDRIRYLQDSAAAIGHGNAEISLISGRPDRALHEHAATNDFDLVIVAHRRHDLLGVIRGSTAGRLARSADLPVLIGPSI